MRVMQRTAHRYTDEETAQIRAYLTESIPELLHALCGISLRGDRCPCPLHGGTGLNFAVTAGGWFCHSKCQTGGDGIALAMRLTRRAFRDVLDMFAGNAGVHRRTGASGAPGIVVHPRAEHRTRATHIRRPCSALRDEGMVPAAVAETRRIAYESMRLGAHGRRFLAERGLPVTLAEGFGFRSMETPADWRRMAAALGESVTLDERQAAGLEKLPPPVASDSSSGSKLADRALVIPYRDQSGCIVDWRLRALHAEQQGWRYRTLRGGGPPAPFNAPALATVRGNTLIIVEGEFNAFALSVNQRHAIGLGGAGQWPAAWTEYVLAAGPAEVVLWFDDDPAGEQGAAKLFATLTAAGVPVRRTVLLPPPDANDRQRNGTLAELLHEVRL